MSKGPALQAQELSSVLPLPPRGPSKASAKQKSSSAKGTAGSCPWVWLRLPHHPCWDPHSDNTQVCIDLRALIRLLYVRPLLYFLCLLFFWDCWDGGETGVSIPQKQRNTVFSLFFSRQSAFWTLTALPSTCPVCT